MRRLFAGLLIAIGVIVVIPSSQPHLSGQFVTNTPRPIPTDPILFFTNTPRPTQTPDFTLTPSNTPTATFTPTLTPSNTPTPTPTPVGPFSYPDGINSLTGLAYPDEAAQNRRNLMIKISNYPPIVRPQSGLNQADVVWEYEVEGGVTRFAAIYRSNAPTHVGPVRSGRLVDLELAPMYNSLFAYSGSSQPIMDMILNAEIVPWGFNVFSPQFGDNCEDAGFCRFPREGLAFEHTLYLDTNVLWDKATRREVNRPERARGFAFGEEAQPTELRAVDVFVDWYGQINARWQYQAASGRYVRFTDEVPHLDALDGDQVWADNLIIVQAEHIERPDLFEPESQSASQEIRLWTEPGGYYPVYVLRDSVYYQGFWDRQNREMGSALQLKFSTGEPIKLKPGRTWVMIVRGMGSVTLLEVATDMNATGTAILQTATATPPLWETPTPLPR